MRDGSVDNTVNVNKYYDVLARVGKFMSLKQNVYLVLQNKQIIYIMLFASGTNHLFVAVTCRRRRLGVVPPRFP